MSETDETEYRIEYSIQRLLPGEEDFTEIGFGSSGGWSTPEQAMHIAYGLVQNHEWETEPGMPDPDDIKREVETAATGLIRRELGGDDA